MEAYRRVFWLVFSAAIPSASMICALVYQIKRVEVSTSNAEAELLLDRQARLRHQLEQALAE